MVRGHQWAHAVDADNRGVDGEGYRGDAVAS
jgi:hypothetical protein